MEGDLVPSQLIRKTIRSWWVFPLLMILGGLAGMVFSRIQKPVYQAQGIITTAVDYAYAGRLEDYELDHLILTVGDIIDSTDVKQLVLAAAESSIPGLTEADLSKNLTAIRKGNDWILSTRADDADAVKILADAWVNSAMAALLQMNQTALAEYHNQVAMLSIENCFSQSVASEQAASVCSMGNIQKLQGTLFSSENSSDSLRTRIILTNLSFEVTTKPEKPSTPLLFRQSLNVTVGVFIGLLAALAWFFFGEKARK